MKDKLNHHEGLPLRDVRDFLADQIADSDIMLGFADSTNIHEPLLVAALEEAKKALNSYRQGRGMRVLYDKVTKENGWQEFDVSNHVAYCEGTYRSFIGTKEEALAKYPEVGESDYV